MVQLLGLGAHTSLLHTATYGRRLRQRRPPRPSHMHQSIHRMSLVHALRFPFRTRPPACRRRRHSPAFVRGQPPASTATLHDTGRRGSVRVACRARTRVFGAGFDGLEVRGDALGPMYAAAALCCLLTPPARSTIAKAPKIEGQTMPRVPRRRHPGQQGTAAAPTPAAACNIVHHRRNHRRNHRRAG